MPLVGREKRQRRRHDIGHHPRPLRAAGHQNVHPPPDVFGIGKRRRGDHRRPHGIAGHADFCLDRAIDGLQGKAAGDPGDAGTQESVGPSHHRVLLMQDGRNPEQRRGQQRRHGRIAAEADHGARPDGSELQKRGRKPGAERERGARLGERAGVGGRRGRKGVNGAGGKIAAVFERPAVGREFDFRPALGERGGERGRGKEMAARAAGREQDRAAHAHSSGGPGWSRSAAGRLRVAAMRKPMPRPSASSDEPP